MNEHSERRGPYDWDTSDTWRIGFDPKRQLRVKLDSNVSGPSFNFEFEWHSPGNGDDAMVMLWADFHASLGSLTIPSCHLPHLLHVLSYIFEAEEPHTDDAWRELFYNLNARPS
jgi:hypothetical protein